MWSFVDVGFSDIRELHDTIRTDLHSAIHIHVALSDTWFVGAAVETV